MPPPVARPLPEGATLLQRSLIQLQSQRLPRNAFAAEAIKLIVEGSGVQAGVLLEYNHPGRLTALANVAMDDKVLELLLGRSGKWIPLRCVNERQVNIIEPAHQNPFVSQPLINAIGSRFLGIGSFPLMRGESPIGVVVLLSFVGGAFTEALLANLAEALPICATVLAETGATAARPSSPATSGFAAVRPREPIAPREPNAPRGQPPSTLLSLLANRGQAPALSDEPAVPRSQPPAALEGLLTNRGATSAREPLRVEGASPSARGPRPSPLPASGRAGMRALDSERPALFADTPDVPRLVQLERQRVVQLEQQLNALRVTVEGQSRLLQEADGLRDELDESRRTAEGFKAQAERLRAALEEAGNNARQSAKTIDELRRDRGLLQQRINEGALAAENTRAATAELENRIRDLEARNAMVAQLQEALATGDATRSVLAADLIRMREEVVAAHAEALQQENAAAAAQSEAAALAAELAEVRDARRRADEEAVSVLTRERDDARLQLQAAAMQAEQRSERIGELEEHVRELTARAAQLSEIQHASAGGAGARSAADAELQQVRDALAQLQSAHTETEAVLRQRSEDLAIARFEGISLATRLADAQDKLDRLEANQSEMAQTRTDLESLKASHRTLQREFEQAKTALSKRERDEDAVARAWASKLATVENERQRVQDDLNRLAEQTDAAIAQFEAQITEGIVEQQNLVRRITELEAERPELLARIEALQQPQPAATPTAATAAAPTDEASALARELLLAFQFEAAECIQECEKLLLQLEQSPGDRETVNGLFRQFHTLKGAAAAVDLTQAAAQLHEGESLLEALGQGAVATTPRVVDFLFRLTDSIAGLINQAAGTAEGAGGQTHKIMSDVGEEIARLRDGTAEEAPAAEPAAAAERQSAPPPELDTGVVRVATARLDELAIKIGELDLTRGRMHQDIQTLAELRDQLHEWRLALAEIEQQRDTGEGAHAGDGSADTLRDVAAYTGLIAQELERVMTTLDQHGREFSGISAALQQQVNDLRLVPLELVFRRLARPVRDAARQEGKLIDLEIGGGNVPLNREVIDALYAPLLHLVRNAVAHGIEPPDVREQRGKPRTGTIWVTAYQRHGQTVITVADDGAGLNFDAVLRKARERGLIGPDETPPREEALTLILQPGFSTKETVNDLAGRGVGMDVVAREVETLGGTLEIESEDGYGMTMRLAFAGTGGAEATEDAAAEEAPA